MDLIALTTTEEIKASSAKEFTLSHCSPPLSIFVVRKNNRFSAYVNRCPHRGVTLNWQPDQFFDIDNEYIQCATHGALFNVEHGYCVRGPCAGSYLQAVKIRIKNGVLYYDTLQLPGGGLS